MDVDRRRRRCGRRRADGCGRAHAAARAVIAGVTPTQLYGPLLGDPAGPRRRGAAAASATAGRRCRSTSRSPSRRAGKATSGSAQTAIVHLTPGPRRRLARRQRGRRAGCFPPRRPSSAASRSTIDPSRAPDGKGILWIQLQELPWQVKGDAAGEIDVGDGTWTESLRERYADRIQQRLAAPHPEPRGARSSRGRRSRRPTSQRANPNLASRRPLRRLARARPELPLAPLRRGAGPPHGDRQPLARRREHLARPRARRRLGHARRPGAAGSPALASGSAGGSRTRT